jgi:hypothetical protein
MANETIYDIKIESADAQTKVDKLVQSLKDAKKYVDSIGDGFKNIGKFSAPMPGFARGASPSGSDEDSPTNRDLEQRFKRDSIDHYKVMKDYGKDFKLYAPQFNSTMRGVMGSVTSLMRLAAGGFVIGGAMRAMDAAANNVVQDKKRALALSGADVGKMRAAGFAFGNLPLDVPGTVGKISDGQFDITSKPYLVLKLLGFSNSDIEGKDPSDLMSEALGREANRVRQYSSKGTVMPIEQARGAADLFGPDIIKAFSATGDKAIDIGKLTISKKIGSLSSIRFRQRLPPTFPLSMSNPCL